MEHLDSNLSNFQRSLSIELPPKFATPQQTTKKTLAVFS